MSSSSVSSGVVGERSVVGERGLPSKCLCGRDVTIFTSKTQENPGRPFFRCSSKRDPHSWANKKDGCLFKWVEDAVFEEVEDGIPKLGILANEIVQAKFETNELKAMMQEMKEDAMWRKMQIEKLKMSFKICFVWLFMMTIVLIWIMVGKAKGKHYLVAY